MILIWRACTRSPALPAIAPVRHGSPATVRRGSPGTVRRGSPGTVRRGSPDTVRRGSPDPAVGPDRRSPARHRVVRSQPTLSRAFRRPAVTPCGSVRRPATTERPATTGSSTAFLAFAILFARTACAADLPDPARVETVKLLEVPNYCEGVVFDHDGYGYISWKDTITQFTLDGKQKVWAVTGAPNGHKILGDGTHLVCDASHHAVLHLDANGKMLEPASKECDGMPLRGPNDLTLDAKNGGFYFTDPGDSGLENLIGTVHYVDAQGRTHLVAGGLAYSNGIVVALDGKRLLVAESQKNRVLEYPLLAPGKVGPMKVFADLPKHESGRWQDDQPDGMCLDAAGNLYVAHYGMKQVQVLSPEGKLLARYNGGNRTTSNVAFGGPNRDQLFITGGLDAEGGPGGLFRIDLKVKGLMILPPRK